MEIPAVNSITLESALPKVFVNENIPSSDVWQTTLTFEKGNCYLVEAASGGGKSSMCAYIFGARTDYEGRILFNGEDVSRFGISRWQEIRRRHIAYLPQELSLFPELSAWDNIQLKNRLTGYASDRMVESWMERLGVAAFRDRPAGRLSIGQQQRVAIIRAVCQPFDFLMLDEPVSHLDGENNLEAARLVTEEASRQGAGIISTSVGNHIKLGYTDTLKL